MIRLLLLSILILFISCGPSENVKIEKKTNKSWADYCKEALKAKFLTGEEALKKMTSVEGIPFPSAIMVGFDGLYFGAVPNLLFVPDKNQDDKADENVEVRLTGWGIRDRHEVLNSFSWGLDGWLLG
jgi:hypothetical protein